MVSKAGTNTSEIARVQRRGSRWVVVILWSFLQIPGRYDVILRVGKKMERLLKGSVQGRRKHGKDLGPSISCYRDQFPMDERAWDYLFSSPGYVQEVRFRGLLPVAVFGGLYFRKPMVTNRHL